MRAFVAIALPDPVRDALEVLQHDLPAGRPVPEENLHLTLAFLGDQPEWLLAEGHQALAAIRAPAFPLELAGVDSFGGPHPRGVFATVAACAPLAALERRVTGALRRAGLDFPRQRFRPHVTLARFSGALPAHALPRVAEFLGRNARFRSEVFVVEHFALYRSTLSRAGAEYDALARYALSP